MFSFLSEGVAQVIWMIVGRPSLKQKGYKSAANVFIADRTPNGCQDGPELGLLRVSPD